MPSIVTAAIARPKATSLCADGMALASAPSRQREGFAGRGECRRDLRLAMRRRNEARFERRRREVDAALEHRVEEPVEGLAVALHHFGKRTRRCRAEEKA